MVNFLALCTLRANEKQPPVQCVYAQQISHGYHNERRHSWKVKSRIFHAPQHRHQKSRGAHLHFHGQGRRRSLQLERWIYSTFIVGNRILLRNESAPLITYICLKKAAKRISRRLYRENAFPSVRWNLFWNAWFFPNIIALVSAGDDDDRPFVGWVITTNKCFRIKHTLTSYREDPFQSSHRFFFRIGCERRISICLSQRRIQSWEVERVWCLQKPVKELCQRSEPMLHL